MSNIFIDSNIWVYAYNRVKPDSAEVVGFLILNFRKWFKDAKDIKVLPVKGELVFS